MGELIDRQAAIDALNGLQVKKHMPKETQVTLESAKAIMRLLPSAQPERKKGKWIDKGWNGDWQYQMDGRGRSWHEWQCSECNHITKGAKWHFCPNCGAKMEGTTE